MNGKMAGTMESTWSNLWSIVQSNAHANFMDLSNSGITDQLLQILDYINVEWRVLDLSQNQIGPVGAWILAKHISKFVDPRVPSSERHLSRLTDLRLGYNFLGDEGIIRYLAPVLPYSQIHRLDLEGNGISDDGVRALSMVLPQSQVRELYLSHNSISDAGVAALCPNIANLTILDLFTNKLTDHGINMLSESIPNGLLELYLGGHIRVTDVSIVKLAKALGNSRVRHLGLMKNSITDVGVRALIGAAKRADLTEVLLHANPASPEICVEMERVLAVKDLAWFKIVVLLCAGKTITRVGHASLLRLLPLEVIRRVAFALPYEERHDHDDPTN